MLEHDEKSIKILEPNGGFDNKKINWRLGWNSWRNIKYKRIIMIGFIINLIIFILLFLLVKEIIVNKIKNKINNFLKTDKENNLH